MTLGRARVIKGYATSPSPGTRVGLGPSSPPHGLAMARRVPGAILDAKAEAARIVDEARASAAAVASEAAKEAREKELARLAAELVTLRVTEEAKALREIDRTVEIAKLLAERIIGEALVMDPARIGALAVEALKETRGARDVRFEAAPADVPALTAVLSELGITVAKIEARDDLGRGSLVVHTELGRVDARLEPQLARLAEALREAMIEERRS